MPRHSNVTATLVTACFFVAALAATGLRADVSSATVQKLAAGPLATIATDVALIEAVKAQNANGRTLTEIQQLDKKWMATPGLDDFMRTHLESPLGRKLLEFVQANPFLSEIFVMDRLGANVAMSAKTTDYWQGDEDKFTETVKNGGRVWIGKQTFDESTQTYSIQVSLPVKDGGTVIGAVCFGIDVEKL